MEKMNSYWKPCMPSKAWKNQSIGVLVLALLILGWAIVASVCIAIMEKSFVSLAAVIVILTFGVGQLLYFSFIFVIERRKYQMTKEGISILYAGRIRKFYPWAVFPEIVVCDFNHAPKNPPNCNLVIRLAEFEEPHGPHSKKHKYTLAGIETWRGYHYTMRNFTKILFLEYSPELLDEVMYFSNLQAIFSLTKYGKTKLNHIS